MNRSDLPNGFPFRLLDEGFAILLIKIQNTGDQTASVSVSDLAVLDSRSKVLKRAEPEEITPEIVSFYTAVGKGIHGEGYYGFPRRPSAMEMSRMPTVDTAPGVHSVSASIGQDIRESLSSFELRDCQIMPGQVVEGYYYIKSKKFGNKLSGSVQLGGEKSRFN